MSFRIVRPRRPAYTPDTEAAAYVSLRAEGLAIILTPALVAEVGWDKNDSIQIGEGFGADAGLLQLTREDERKGNYRLHHSNSGSRGYELATRSLEQPLPPKAKRQKADYRIAEDGSIIVTLPWARRSQMPPQGGAPRRKAESAEAPAPVTGATEPLSEAAPEPHPVPGRQAGHLSMLEKTRALKTAREARERQERAHGPEPKSSTPHS